MAFDGQSSFSLIYLLTYISLYLFIYFIYIFIYFIYTQGFRGFTSLYKGGLMGIYVKQVQHAHIQKIN